MRYIGVNTSEIKHPCGPKAVGVNRKLIEGKTVRLELDAQPWERSRWSPWNPRLLAYVYVGDVMVNAELVRQGYAQVATVPPNVKDADYFE